MAYHMDMPQTESRRVGAGPVDLSTTHGESEVLISGVHTGPGDAERQNRTPTEDHARFQAHTYARDEDT